MYLIKKAPLAVLLAASMGSAAATPVEVAEQYAIGTTQPIAPITGSALPYSFVLDISNAFGGGVNVMTAGVVTMLLSDPDGGKEKYLFGLGPTQVYSKPGANANDVSHSSQIGSYAITLDAGALSALSADGRLTVTVGATSGGYMFHGAHFSGQAERVILQQVPERCR